MAWTVAATGAAGARHREHRVEDPVGARRLLGADLDPRAGRERGRDPLRAAGAAPSPGSSIAMWDRSIERYVGASMRAASATYASATRSASTGSVTFSPKKSIELRTPSAASRRAVASASSAVAPAT